MNFNISAKQLSQSLRRLGFSDSVATFDNDKLYTNPEIKKIFISLVKNQDLLKPILNNVILLTDKGIIVPVYVSDPVLKRIKKLFGFSVSPSASSKFTLAFFDSKHKKIFILIENIKNSKYWSIDGSIGEIILHELQHMTAMMVPNLFMAIHQKSLIKYYKLFFKIYFSVDVDDKTILFLIKWLHSKFELHRFKSRNYMIDYLDIIKKILKKSLSEEEANEKSKIYIKQVYNYVTDKSQWISDLLSKKKENYNLFYALYKSYRSLNIIKLNTICIQEVLFPGEVICMESQYNTNNKHYVLIKRIK